MASIERVEIECKHKEQHGLKIVQISDIHFDLPYSNTMTMQLLNNAIDLINGEKPDFVFITGDFITHEYAPAFQLSSELNRITASRGTYAVLGNHDCFKNGAKEYVQLMLESRGNMTLLHNSSVKFSDLKLTIVGFGDLWSNDFQPQKAMLGVHSNDNDTTIALVHNPDTAEYLKRYSISLQLSGHTHHGQIVVPFFDQPFIVWLKYVHDTLKNIPLLSNLAKYVPGRNFFGVVKNWQWSQGLFRIANDLGGQNKLYVNRGLGSHKLFANIYPRLFCDPEITVFTLKHASSI